MLVFFLSEGNLPYNPLERIQTIYFTLIEFHKQIN